MRGRGDLVCNARLGDSRDQKNAAHHRSDRGKRLGAAAARLAPAEALRVEWALRGSRGL